MENYGLDLVTNEPTVIRLEVHLYDQQNVYFREGQESTAAVRGNIGTKLTAWFNLNNDPQMRETCIGLDQLKYPDIPNSFTWNSGDFKWKPREVLSIRDSNTKKYDFRRRADPVIGRMYIVSPRERERYFLRTLLLHQKGASSYEELRRINGIQYGSFRDA